MAEDIGYRIRLLRIWRGLSQKQLAEQVNYSVSTIQSVEERRRKPGFELICQLSQVLQVDIDYFTSDVHLERLTSEQLEEFITYETKLFFIKHEMDCVLTMVKGKSKQKKKEYLYQV